MKQRRIGTFTLGLSLITIGVLITLTVIFKDKALQILQFAPIVLIFLGIEILVYAFKPSEEKLKYDGLSIFMVIAITIVTIGATATAPIVQRAVAYHDIIEQEEESYTNQVEEVMLKNKIDGGFDLYCCDFNEYSYILNENAKKHLYTNIHLYINVKDGDTENDIIDTIYSFLSDIKSLDININNIDLNIKSKNEQIGSQSMHYTRYQLKSITKERVRENLIVNRKEDISVNSEMNNETANNNE